MKAWERLVWHLDDAAPLVVNEYEIMNFFDGQCGRYGLNPFPTKATIQKAKEFIFDRHTWEEADAHIKLKMDTLDLILSWGKTRWAMEHYANRSRVRQVQLL